MAESEVNSRFCVNNVMFFSLFVQTLLNKVFGRNVCYAKKIK